MNGKMGKLLTWLTDMGSFRAIVVSVVGVVAILAGGVATLWDDFERRVEFIALEAGEKIMRKHEAAQEVIARRVSQSVIEESVPRAHQISVQESRAQIQEHVAGLHAERLREIERIYDSMERLANEIRQLRDEIRDLRSSK